MVKNRLDRNEGNRITGADVIDDVLILQRYDGSKLRVDLDEYEDEESIESIVGVVPSVAIDEDSSSSFHNSVVDVSSGMVTEVYYTPSVEIIGNENRTVTLLNTGRYGTDSTIIASLVLDETYVDGAPILIPVTPDVALTFGDRLIWGSTHTDDGLVDPGGIVDVEVFVGYPRNLERFSSSLPSVLTGDDKTTNISVAEMSGKVLMVIYVPHEDVIGDDTNGRIFSLVNIGSDGMGTDVIAELDLMTGIDLMANVINIIPLLIESIEDADMWVDQFEVLQWRSIHRGTGVEDPGGIVNVVHGGITGRVEFAQREPLMLLPFENVESTPPEEVTP